MNTKLLKAEAVAQILNVPKQRVYELTRERKIPFIQLGDRQYRYSETALVEWLENGGVIQPITEIKGEYGCLTPLS